MKTIILLITLLLTGCISQRLSYNGYEDEWYMQTTTKDYERTCYFSNFEDFKVIMERERDMAEYFRGNK